MLGKVTLARTCVFRLSVAVILILFEMILVIVLDDGLYHESLFA
jgi:hypothetical protein